jgi:putative transposase
VPENGQILAQDITKEKNMLIAERFLSCVVRCYGNHPVSTDGGTWYPQACEFSKWIIIFILLFGEKSY